MSFTQLKQVMDKPLEFFYYNNVSDKMKELLRGMIQPTKKLRFNLKKLDSLFTELLAEKKKVKSSDEKLMELKSKIKAMGEKEGTEWFSFICKFFKQCSELALQIPNFLKELAPKNLDIKQLSKDCLNISNNFQTL